MAPRMSRRGFFGRLFGRKAFSRACFAVQVVIHAEGIEDLRDRLHELMDQPGEEGPAEKRRYYKRLTSLLLEAEPYYEYASYSYVEDEDEALAEFDEWVSELEAGMATEPEEAGEEVDGYHRLSSEKRYIVVSLVFLLTKPNPVAAELDDEDEDTYTRPVIGQLIDSINLLDFEHGVEADANFLMPGSSSDGFSWADLADEGWEHLVMLRSA